MLWGVENAVVINCVRNVAKATTKTKRPTGYEEETSLRDYENNNSLLFSTLGTIDIARPVVYALCTEEGI